MTPGETLRDALKEAGQPAAQSPADALREALGDFTQGWLADRSKISQPHLNMILQGRRRITPWVAKRLALAGMGTAESWLAIQGSWDLQQIADREEANA